MAGLRSFSGTLPTSPELNILGLYFVDPKIEEEFLAEHFNSLFRVHVTMFAIITCLLALISSVPAWSEALGITYDSPQVLAVMPATLIRTLAHLFMPIETAHHTLHRLFIFMAAWPIALRLLPYIRALYLFEEFPPSPNGEGAPRISVVYHAISLCFFPVQLHLFPTTLYPRIALLAIFGLVLVLESQRDEDAASALVCLVIGMLIGHTIELYMRQTYLSRREQTSVSDNSRRADSRLNHVLKNKSAEARFLIEEVTDGLRAIKQAAAAGQTDKVYISRLLDNLSKVQLIHEQTVEWTHMRELFMQLQYGTYKSSAIPTDMAQLFRRVMGTDESVCKVEMGCRDVLCVDASILQLQLEEARSNALKYREPGSQLVVRVQLEQSSAYSTPTLHTMIDNENRSGLRALTPEECVAVFEPGRKALAAGTLSPSNGLGLDNVGVAAEALGGSAWLSTYCHPRTSKIHTVFHVRVPAKVADESEAAMARRQAKAMGIPTRKRSGVAGSAGGVRERSCENSKASSSCNSSSASSEDPPWSKMMGGYTPLCLGLDDSEMLQQLLDAVFLKLGADPNSKSLGSTAEEQEGFVDLALGNYDLPAADIVVLDQNLNLQSSQKTSIHGRGGAAGGEGKDTITRPSGTDVARLLHSRGFQGMIVIHSGLSQQELAEVNALPYIDLVVSKGYSAMRLANELAFSFVAKMEGRKKEEVIAEYASADMYEPPLPSSKEGTSNEGSFQQKPVATSTATATATTSKPSPSRKEVNFSEGSQIGGGGSSCSVLGGGGSTSEKIPVPLSDVPKVDFSHLEGFNHERLQRVVGPFFDARSNRAASKMIDSLEQMMRDGEPTKDLAHRLKGDATTSGAAGFAAKVALFEKEPKIELLDELRVTLEATKARLLADGVLRSADP